MVTSWIADVLIIIIIINLSDEDSKGKAICKLIIIIYIYISMSGKIVLQFCSTYLKFSSPTLTLMLICQFVKLGHFIIKIP